MRQAQSRRCWILSVTAAAVACGGDLPSAPPLPEAARWVLHLDADSVALPLGTAVHLTATVTDSSGAPVIPAPVLRWESAAGPVAQVSEHGDAQATGLGTGYVMVTDGWHLDSVRLRVYGRYAEVYAGTDVTCARTPSGRALCWGWNAFGSVGDGTRQDAWTPVPVATDASFGRLVSGGGSTCGMVGGIPHCWGYNGVGQLGDGTIRDRLEPIAVADSFALRHLAIGAGATSCGVDLGGRTICWGWNAFGQLLDGTQANRHWPVFAAVGFAPAVLATGAGHVCALDAAGAAWCWGRNDHGQLGDGTTLARAVPTPVLGGLAFVSLTAGSEHSCGRTPAGAVWCWGNNAVGQLGGAAASYSSVPVAAAGGQPFDTVTSSGVHSCALAGGAAFCWGANADGELGRGDFTASGMPAAVHGGFSFRNISAGTAHTCGVTTDGVIYCWGRNRYGALGNGTRLDAPAPERVALQ